MLQTLMEIEERAQAPIPEPRLMATCGAQAAADSLR